MEIEITLPTERFRAIHQTQDFLRRLLDPKATPRVPKEIRREARAMLKHYPSRWELQKIADITEGEIIASVKGDE